MLEYDDQLPEERAHPELLQELQTTYHIKQEDEQVLARVREQLLKETAQPLSRKELAPIEASPHDGGTRLQFSPFHQPTQRKWVRRLNTFAAILFVAALVGALAFTFSSINHARTQTGASTSPETVKKFVNLTGGLRLYMVNAQVGWEMGDNAHNPYTTILRTTDGGKHWRSVAPAGLQLIGALYIIDENTAWLPVWNAKKSIYPTALYRTTNGGTSWQYFNCPNSLLTCGLSIFADQNHGWTIFQPVNDPSKIRQQTLLSKQPVAKIVKPELYHTNDGGKTWQSVANLPNSDPIPQLSFLNAQTGWISTRTTTISSNKDSIKGLSTTSEFFITHDGGHTWKVQHLPVPPGERPQSGITLLPTFLNEREGYLITHFGTHSYLYITQDSGNSWQISGNALPDNVFPKNLVDMQHMVASTPASGLPTPQVTGNIVMLTLTHGKWVKTILSQPGNKPTVDYSFTSKDVGIALINASPSTFDMYKTTNGGKTWQKISTLLRSS